MIQYIPGMLTRHKIHNNKKCITTKVRDHPPPIMPWNWDATALAASCKLVSAPNASVVSSTKPLVAASSGKARFQLL
jgi:hypothetical protein